MRFPIANISQEWNLQENFIHYILMDPFIYKKDDQFFSDLYLNNKFVDSEGKIYQVVDRRLPASWWRRTFHFLPDIYKVTLLFVKTEERMDMEAVREFVLRQVVRVKKAEGVSNWLEQIKKAKTIQEILGGK